MESTLLGLVLDSSTVFDAERKKQPVTAFIENILAAHDPANLSLSPGHGSRTRPRNLPRKDA